MLRRFSPPFSSGELEIQRSEHRFHKNEKLGLLDVVNGSVLKPTERLCGLSIIIEVNETAEMLAVRQFFNNSILEYGRTIED